MGTHKRIYNECPICGKASKILKTVSYSKIVKEIFLACTNVECAHTYVVSQSFSRSISIPRTSLKEDIQQKDLFS